MIYDLDWDSVDDFIPLYWAHELVAELSADPPQDAVLGKWCQPDRNSLSWVSLNTSVWELLGWGPRLCAEQTPRGARYTQPWLAAPVQQDGHRHIHATCRGWGCPGQLYWSTVFQCKVRVSDELYQAPSKEWEWKRSFLLILMQLWHLPGAWVGLEKAVAGEGSEDFLSACFLWHRQAETFCMTQMPATPAPRQVPALNQPLPVWKCLDFRVLSISLPF